METVKIKGSGNGFIVVLDPSIPFDELKNEFQKKIIQTASFFGNSEKALMFRGRNLNEEEEEQLLDIILSNSSMRVACVLSEDTSLNEVFTEYVERFREKSLKAQFDMDSEYAESLVTEPVVTSESKIDSKGFDGNALIHNGNIRSGQSLSSSNSIVVFGDVNPGGSVISDGCIFVYGSLLGNATAGYRGNTDAFIMANDFHPLQVRIGDVIAISPNEEAGKSGRLLGRIGKVATQVPEVCYLSEGAIARSNFDDIFLKKQTFFN